jgi:hypothetical protein
MNMTFLLYLVQKFKWNYTSPSICLHGMYRDNFIFTYTNVISSASLSKTDIHTNVVSLVLHNIILTYKLALQSTNGQEATYLPYHPPKRNPIY